MEQFWAFINKRSTRLALALLCFVMAIRGCYRIYLADSKSALFQGGGELLLWFSWALINYLKANGREMPKLNICVNVGIAMMIVGLFF